MYTSITLYFCMTHCIHLINLMMRTGGVKIAREVQNLSISEATVPHLAVEELLIRH